MPAPQWFFRFLYDLESNALERRHDEPASQRLINETVRELTSLVPSPGPIVDLGCGPGHYTIELARCGYDAVGIDGSPRMIDVALTRAKRDNVDVTFNVLDVSAPLPFPDASLGGVLAVLVLQHMDDPESFIAEIRRCLRPGGYLSIVAPVRVLKSTMRRSLYWRTRAAVFTYIPGLVRFYDTDALTRLLEGEGLTIVESEEQLSRLSAIARA